MLLICNKQIEVTFYERNGGIDMIQWYCEDGNDNWIEIFDTKKKAKEYLSGFFTLSFSFQVFYLLFLIVDGSLGA